MRSLSKKILKPIKLYLDFIIFLALLNVHFIKICRNLGPGQTIRALKWFTRKFDSPAPNFVKWDVLMRWGSQSLWVETGTYLGETTAFLSKSASKVISIEPSSDLAARASAKFRNTSKVKIVQGTSEQVLNETLRSLNHLEKSDLNFWLDGHYSAGITYLGDIECPIPEELSIIDRHLLANQKITILIDDVRSFSPAGETRNGYPSLSYLAEWADFRKLFWTIEHDIFIMTNRRKYS